MVLLAGCRTSSPANASHRRPQGIAYESASFLRRSVRQPVEFREQFDQLELVQIKQRRRVRTTSRTREVSGELFLSLAESRRIKLAELAQKNDTRHAGELGCRTRREAP